MGTRTTPASERDDGFAVVGGDRFAFLALMSTALFAAGLDGTRIHVRRREGPSPVTALLSDGIACDGFIWKYLWDDLAPLLPLTHWHYRGHGRSAPPADPLHVTIADHAS